MLNTIGLNYFEFRKDNYIVIKNNYKDLNGLYYIDKSIGSIICFGDWSFSLEELLNKEKNKTTSNAIKIHKNWFYIKFNETL